MTERHHYEKNIFKIYKRIQHSRLFEEFVCELSTPGFPLDTDGFDVLLGPAFLLLPFLSLLTGARRLIWRTRSKNI